jgi:23S rRNA pseudouridine1911/1915/1917 synthase
MTPAQSNAVDESLVGKTILAVLRAHRPELSWKMARAALAARRVSINGVLCQDEARRLNVGDLVELSDKPRPKAPRQEQICIRYYDEDLVVVEKPAGMLTERPAAEAKTRRPKESATPSLDELLPRVISEYEGRRLRPDEQSVFIVHRLDRDASGLLVVARTPEAREGLTKQFAARTPSRVYWAIVVGRVEPQTIRTHFVRDRGDGKRGSVELQLQSPIDADNTDVQLAITHVKPLKSWRGQTLLECRLETGRTNQIRIHLAELGHPILGDVKYGPMQPERTTARLALHAMELEFVHPLTGETLRFQSEWPNELPLP